MSASRALDLTDPRHEPEAILDAIDRLDGSVASLRSRLRPIRAV